MTAELIFEWTPPEPPQHPQVAQAYRIYDDDGHEFVCEYKNGQWQEVLLTGPTGPMVAELLRLARVGALEPVRLAG